MEEQLRYFICIGGRRGNDVTSRWISHHSIHAISRILSYQDKISLVLNRFIKSKTWINHECLQLSLFYLHQFCTIFLFLWFSEIFHLLKIWGGIWSKNEIVLCQRKEYGSISSGRWRMNPMSESERWRR